MQQALRLHKVVEGWNSQQVQENPERQEDVSKKKNPEPMQLDLPVSTCVRCPRGPVVMHCWTCGLRHCVVCSDYKAGNCLQCSQQESEAPPSNKHFRMCPKKLTGNYWREWLEHDAPGTESPDEALMFIQRVLLQGTDNLTWEEKEH